MSTLRLAEARVDGLSTRRSWELSMTPVDPMLSGVIKEITLQGGQYLRSVKIFEINGDNTLMKFSNHHERSDVEPETN